MQTELTFYTNISSNWSLPG